MIRAIVLSLMLTACAQQPMSTKQVGDEINPPQGAVLFCKENADHERCQPEGRE